MADNIEFTFKNPEETKRYFQSLNEAVQMKILLPSFKEAGKVINDQARANFNSLKKNASKTGYAGLSQLFKVETIKSLKGTDRFGVRVGMGGKSAYKYKWIQWGTRPRQYSSTPSGNYFAKNESKVHRTGAISGNNFFYGAVNNKKEESVGVLSDAIVQSLKKYANNTAS